MRSLIWIPLGPIIAVVWCVLVVLSIPMMFGGLAADVFGDGGSSNWLFENTPIVLFMDAVESWGQRR